MAGRTYRYQTKGIAYPFGFGLSYAKFAAGAVAAEAPAGQVAKVAVPVSNVGKTDGTAVVQLYVSTPNAGKGAPLKSLVAFRRVPLKAGASTTVEFTVSEKRLMEFNADGVATRAAGELKFSVQL